MRRGSHPGERSAGAGGALALGGGAGSPWEGPRAGCGEGLASEQAQLGPGWSAGCQQAAVCWPRGGLVSAGRVLRTEVKPGLGRGLVGERASWGVGQRCIPGPMGEDPKVDTGQRGER